MTKQQFDDLYLGKSVHCDTEEKANKFLALAHGVGYRWFKSVSLLHLNCWNWYREQTCYKVNNYGVTFADVKFYKNDGVSIVKFELEPIEEIFNVGDVVYDDGGQRLEVIGFGVKVRTKNKVEFYRPQEVLSKTKPLQKITRKELADKGYELVD